MRWLVLALILLSTPAYAESYFKGPWVWNEKCLGDNPCWQPPVGSKQGMDLRSDSEQMGGGEGIFISDAFEIKGYEKLTKEEATDYIWQKVTTFSDADGFLSSRPLMPNDKGELQLKFGDITVSEKIDFASQHGQKVVEVMRRGYEALPDEQGKRYLGAIEKQFGFNPVLEVEPLEPHTTITESFDKADNGLGPDLTWTNAISTMGVTSNQFVSKAGSGNYSAARADSDLSSADNYAQISVTALDPVGSGSGDQVKVGVNTRQSTISASTFYSCTVFSNGTGAKYNIVSKFIAGVETQLVVDGPSQTHPSTPFDLKLNVSGSTVEMYVGGALEESTVDVAIVSNLRTGIFCYFAGSGDAKGDAFIASDGLNPVTTIQRAYVI